MFKYKITFQNENAQLWENSKKFFLHLSKEKRNTWSQMIKDVFEKINKIKRQIYFLPSKTEFDWSN